MLVCPICSPRRRPPRLKSCEDAPPPPPQLFSPPINRGYHLCWIATADAVSRGIYTMDSFLAAVESGIESQLIDLGAVSMTALRELDDTVFRQALRHVMQQTAHPQVTASGGSQRVD
jgi:FXSXX-COOH protein